MKKIFAVIFMVHGILGNCQSFQWQTMPNSPTAPYRHDDIFVLDSKMWSVNVDGEIWKSDDLGQSWTLMVTQPATYFRCVGFVDSLRGFAGNLGADSWGPSTDTNCLYKTLDGGSTWNAVTNISGPRPYGLCGINVYSDSVINACGRVQGPAWFMRSVDGGNSWTSQDMSAYALSLVDCYFFSRDSGFVVGGDDSVMSNARAVVLFTADGGNTWTNAFTSPTTGTHCWKVSFPSRSAGYVSVQCTTAPRFFLKTTDNGQTWTQMVYSTVPLNTFEQGIGFINDTLGWIGGGTKTFLTQDGGSTWQFVTLNQNINRFRFINDTIGYCSGKRIYTINVNHPLSVGNNSLSGYELYDCQPNPAIGVVTLKYRIPKTCRVQLEVVDVAGRKVVTLVDEVQTPGEYTVDFSAPESKSGIFVYVLNAGEFTDMKKMVIVSGE